MDDKFEDFQKEEYENEGKKSVGIALIWNNKILVTHHPKEEKINGVMSIPKGRQEKFENRNDILTAHRETLEEVGIDVPLPWIADAPKYVAHTEDGRDVVYFIVEIPNLECIGLDSSKDFVPASQYQIEEVDYAQFVPYRIASKYLRPDQRQILDQVSKHCPLFVVSDAFGKRVNDINRGALKVYPSTFSKGGDSSKTPAEPSEQIKGSENNSKGSAESIESAKGIEFSKKVTNSIKNKVDNFNDDNPNKKVSMAFAKAVVRRGMGAYSQTHRPTISGGKDNSRVAWGLARLDSALKKVKTGKSPSGKHTQDDDLIKELGYSVEKKEVGGHVKADFLDLQEYDDLPILLAPNGKPSNLTLEQFNLVRTPQFKEWFGDWENDPENSSKVVDENGEPLVMYHGSRSHDIDVFDASKSSRHSSGLKEFAHFFTSNKELADFYSKAELSKEQEIYLKTKIKSIRDIQNNVRANDEFDKLQEEIDKYFKQLYLGKVYEFFLNVKSPLTFDSKGFDSIGWDLLSLDIGYKNTVGKTEVVEALSGNNNVYKNTDYDGVIAYNLADYSSGIIYNPRNIEEGSQQHDKYKSMHSKYVGTVVAVWNSNQIKLADGTNTSFNPENPDIRFDKGGAIEKGETTIYHGSDQDFDKLSLDKVDDFLKNDQGHEYFGRALYFSENRDVAKYYGKNIIEAKLRESMIDQTIDALGQPLREIDSEIKRFIPKGGIIKVENVADANMQGSLHETFDYGENGDEVFKYPAGIYLWEELKLDGEKGRREEVKKILEDIGVRYFESGADVITTFGEPSEEQARQMSDKGLSVYQQFRRTPSTATTYIVAGEKGLEKLRRNNPDSTFEKGGKTYTEYPKAESKEDLKPNKPMKSWLSDKKMVVLADDGENQDVVHFGHPDYEDFTQHGDLERRENYLSRSAGIEDGDGDLTKDDIFSANYWSRRVLWDSEEEFSEGGSVIHTVPSKLKGLKEDVYAEMSTRNDHYCTIYLYTKPDNNKIGEITLLFFDNESNADYATISNSFIDESYRGEGYYSVLIEKAIEISKNLGFQGIVSRSDYDEGERNDLSERAWKNKYKDQKDLGFEIVESDNDYFASFEKGGVIEGQLHSECNEPHGCGEKFTVGDSKRIIEAEDDEAVIVSAAFKKEHCNYIMKGTLSQIASALNVLGGGKQFDSGAEVLDSEGKPLTCAMNKKEAVDKDVDPHLEPSTIIINRKSMADKGIYEVKGTPKQIASLINSEDGNGVHIKEGGEINKIS